MRNKQQDPQSPGAQPAGKSLGMGGEAVENFHAVQQEAAGGDAPADAGSQQNTAATGRGGEPDRAGSEPLGRQREPADPQGDANVGGGRGGPPPTPAHGQPGGQADESDPPYPTPT